MTVVYRRGGLDTRADVLQALGRQGLDSTADAVLRNFLAREHRASDLRNELQPAAFDALLRETGIELVDVRNAIRLGADADRWRVQDEIEAETRRRDSVSTAAAAVDFVRLRESFDIGELRQLIDSARRAGPSALDQAIAIVKPRLQKMAGAEMGISRAASGAPTLTSGAFMLLNELPHLGRLDGQARLDAVDRRRDAALRLVMDAAGAMHPRLPAVVQQIEAEVKRTQIKGDGPDTKFVVGRYWEFKK
jgi:hypothetical protein